MPIDVERALGATLPPSKTSWDPDRIILYHLGIGAGSPPADPVELRYCYEADLTVIPSFGTIPQIDTLFNLASVEGLDINLAMLLHGEQDLVLERPIPIRADATNAGRVVDIYDKGKAAVVVVEVVTSDPHSGEILFTNRSSVFVRGEGGWGGEPGPAAANQPPERAPDVVAESVTLPQQALLYRLSGDKNPLHADPSFAALAGFDRPILHGLCSYGIVCKAVADHVLAGQPEQVRRYQARFAGVVFPGETIITRMWNEPDRVIVAADTKERQTSVISNAALYLR